MTGSFPWNVLTVLTFQWDTIKYICNAQPFTGDSAIDLYKMYFYQYNVCMYAMEMLNYSYKTELWDKLNKLWQQ